MTQVSLSYWRGTKIRFRENTSDFAVGRPVALDAPDTARIRGLYWTPKNNPKPKVAVIASHPRVDFSEHHSFPALLKAGYGCLGANPRSVNNDLDCLHEKVLVDISTYMVWLFDQGVEQVVLLGNSGGGSLFSFYQQQATLPPEKRFKTTPGGKRTYLEKTEMPEGAALIFMAAHTGQGLIINEVIDPSVIDEHDPLRTDPSLDMYDPRNGFKQPPEWSRYSADFVKRFRAAQIARVHRLDALAHEYIADAERAMRTRKSDGFDKLEAGLRTELIRRSVFEPVMVIHRTLANLHYTDNSLDPSGRPYGSLISPVPHIDNFQRFGFSRVVTPQAWLSTWSGISSNASVPRTAGSVRVPAVVMHPGLDLDIYPNTHSKLIYDTLGSTDKELWEFPGAYHYFEPTSPEEGNRVLDEVMGRLSGWIAERFPL